MSLMAAIAFNACSDDHLETFPTEQVDSESVTSTTTNLMAAINGIHRLLYVRQQDSQGQGGIGGTMIITDILGEDVVFNSTGLGWYVQEYQWNRHRDETSSTNRYPYYFYYRLVSNANVVINGAHLAEGPDAERDAAKGQGLLYRAFSFFQLVQFYADRYVPGANNNQLGIPLRIEANSEPLARSSVEEVYSQINADIDEAISLLDVYSKPNNSHLGLSVAHGLKARVALVQGNYSLAAQHAAIAKQGYILMSMENYQSEFNNYNNSEWMWGSHIVDEQSMGFANFGAYMSRNFSSTSIRTNPMSINSALYDQIPGSDVRSKLWDPSGEHEDLGLPSNFVRYPYTNQKFIAVSTSDSRMDVPYMRAAEMYLIEAEALSYINEGQAREVLYELVSSRDPEYELSTNSGEALKEEIYLQRRIELWGEGFRFYDLKRLNKPLDRNGANHNSSLVGNLFDVPAGGKLWTWLIPRRELDSNPLVEQNPL
ncbi:RagB/SusD family nutrient uptake outer membrane protein [Sinomicrobium pectinilyticum]|uniref:RagB/SusD family nutrient uptake outer membrane protein n=2 Tax=Sinomicrobium pectinilyticum TaxID=1084421 RepID=A0A3N0DYN8_SINP1|nr:RagB/SusD family nutrient uptake outer membrane protein [Sinomicrobium pectinilyticum]